MKLYEGDYERIKTIVKIKKIIRGLSIFLSLMVLVLAIVVIYNFDFNKMSDNNQVANQNYKERGPECSNLSFEDTAICLNDYVRGIFVYNITDDNIDLTLKELKKRGGDCWDWTKFYMKYMESYGYKNTKTVRVFVDRKKGGDKTISSYHVFLVVGHSSGYCNFDMKNLECYQYQNPEGEVP